MEIKITRHGTPENTVKEWFKKLELECMKWKYRLLDRNTRKYSEGVQQETETEMYEVEVQITRQEHQKWFKKLEQESIMYKEQG